MSVNTEVDKRFALKDRDEIKTELLNFKNEVTIFSGHYHFEDEKSVGNIKQYITPASSYQIEKNPNEIKVINDKFGYRVIEFKENSIDTEVVVFAI